MSFEKLREKVLSRAKVEADRIISEAEEKAKRILEQAREERKKILGEMLARYFEKKSPESIIAEAKIKATHMLAEEIRKIYDRTWEKALGLLDECLSDETKLKEVFLKLYNICLTEMKEPVDKVIVSQEFGKIVDKVVEGISVEVSRERGYFIIVEGKTYSVRISLHDIMRKLYDKEVAPKMKKEVLEHVHR